MANKKKRNKPHNPQKALQLLADLHRVSTQEGSTSPEAKKIRGNLRKLGFYVSEIKPAVKMLKVLFDFKD